MISVEILNKRPEIIRKRQLLVVVNFSRRKMKFEISVVITTCLFAELKYLEERTAIGRRSGTSRSFKSAGQMRLIGKTAYKCYFGQCKSRLLQ